MILVTITALIAVCGAAKLDRTYLPPDSAQTAGGSPGSLPTPFARNSFNNGLGGLPKGSYENEFQGVVVNAAAAGTRATGATDSGLGAPRISYGSTDSKVGSAAFKTRPAAFGQAQAGDKTDTNQFQQDDASQGFQQGSNFQAAGFQSSQQSERPRASLDRSAGILRYENEVGPESYHFAYETDNGITAEENGVATNGVQAQGGYSYTGDDGQVYSVSYTADEKGYLPKGDHLPTPPPIPVEILKSLEKNARDEAAGISDDGSYDAQKYNAGSDYTESDGANGKYSHQSSRFGSSEADATASGTFINQNNRPFERPEQNGQKGPVGSTAQNGVTSNRFSDEENYELNTNDDENQSEITQSGQSNFNRQSGQSNRVQASVNRKPGRFGQSGSKGQNSFSSSAQNGSTQGNGIGNRKEYLPPVNNPLNSRPQIGRPQNGKPQNSRPVNGRPQGIPQRPSNSAPETLTQADEDINPEEEGPANFVPLSQQNLQSESRPQGTFTSFGKPVTAPNGLTSTQKKPTNGRRPSNRPSNDFAQEQPTKTENGFKRPNEYLPPKNQNRRPTQNRPQNTNNAGFQYNQQYNSNTQATGNLQSQNRPLTPSFSSTGAQSNVGLQFPSRLADKSQSTFGAQSQQPNGFRRPQPSKPSQNSNQYQISQDQTQFGSLSAQSASNFGLNKPIKATSQPDLELTTPFETSKDESASETDGQSTVSAFTSTGSRPTNGRPVQSTFDSQFNNVQSTFSSQSNSRPQGTTSRPFGQSSSSNFLSQSSSGLYNQNSQFGTQSQNNDAQFASSTQKPSYIQPQGPDDSYYYNQPSRPFGTSQGTRFPSAPSNQFNRINQQSSFTQNRFSDEGSNTFPSNQVQGSTKFPRPSSIVSSTSSAQGQGQFNTQNQFDEQLQFEGQSQGSTKYPRPPTIAPTIPSSTQTQYQGNALNGITQASISSFPSQTPTQSSESLGQFGSRPTFPSNNGQSQTTQTGSSFGQLSFGQQSISSQSIRPQRPGSNNFQSQSQSFGQQSQKEDQTSNAEVEPSVATQQYNGEIYEYNKPAQTLPPPDSTPASSGQFGQKEQGQGNFGGQTSPSQFSQKNDEEDQIPVSQFAAQTPQAAQGSKPQFGQSRPQFDRTKSQNKFTAQAQQPDSKPYGALAQKQNTFAQSSQQRRPQFGAQPSRPQFGQTQSTFEAQSQSLEEPEANIPADNQQPSSFNGQFEQSSQQSSKNQFGFVSPCCGQSSDRKPQNQGFGSQTQFGQNFAGAQTYEPEPTSSFSGPGEQFSGPRQPPSFDEQTGYHY